MFRLAKQQPLS